MVRAHVFVSGRVQGVFFRDSARKEAERRGVAGWARNLPDGRVEAIFEGPEEPVEAMVRWCGEGTLYANVEDVEATREDPEGLEGFRIR